MNGIVMALVIARVRRAGKSYGICESSAVTPLPIFTGLERKLSPRDWSGLEEEEERGRGPVQAACEG